MGEQVAAKLRELAAREYELQARLREAGEALTHEEVRAAQVRDRESATASELGDVYGRLGLEQEIPEQALAELERAEVDSRLERLERRRERLGPVNPLAEREYEEAVAHVEELETQRKDLEAALAELEGLIRETDRRIRESFEETFEAAARNFEDVVQRLFPGGSGRLRRVSAPRPRPVLGGDEQEADEPDAVPADPSAALVAEGGFLGLSDARRRDRGHARGQDHEAPFVALGRREVAGRARLHVRGLPRATLSRSTSSTRSRPPSTTRISTASSRSIRAYADRAQFIVVTHQRRTMEAADVLYGVSMGKDGVSRVVSRRLEAAPTAEPGEALTEAA